MNNSSFIEFVRRDARFYVFIAVYVCAAFLLGMVLGVPHKFVPLAYVGVVPVVLALFIGGGLLSLASGRPFATIGRAIREAARPQHMASLLLFASLCVFMGVFSSVKTMLPDMIPFFADRSLADLDKLLHGTDPWRLLTGLATPAFTRVLEPVYFGIWSVLIPASILAVLLSPKLARVRTQYVWAMLVIWPLLGNLFAAALMSAGPVYYELVTGSDRFGELVDYLARNSAAQPAGQAYLWKSYIAGEAGAGSGISAFPSMHLANATLFVLIAARVHMWLKWAAVAYCLVILWGSVHLGWHYAVDGYAAIAATVLVWKTVGWVLEKTGAPTQRPEPSWAYSPSGNPGSVTTNLAKLRYCRKSTAATQESSP